MHKIIFRVVVEAMTASEPLSDSDIGLRTIRHPRR